MLPLHERIKQIRGDMTRENFARIVGISPRALITYEQNERTPKADVLNRICAQTKASAAWLLMGSGPMYADALSAGPDSAKMADMSELLHCKNVQPDEKANIKKGKMADLSAILVNQQELSNLNSELRDLLRENGDLRVEIERKNARIAELERELVCALKSEETSPMASAG